MKHRPLIIVVLALFLLGGIAHITTKSVQAGYWITAYDVKIVYYHNGVPHYGAFFSGTNGSNQYFTGASGAPADYGSWDWYPPDYYRLLLSKTWLFQHACSGGYGSGPIMCYDRWDESEHHAYMAYH